jgi:uncharacterized protein (TIGR02996 family)
MHPMWQDKVKSGGVDGLAYSPDSGTIYTGDSRGRVTAWDRQSEKPRELFKVKGQHNDRVRQLAATSDQRYLVASADRAPFRVWDIPADELAHDGPTSEYVGGMFALAPDNRTVIYSEGFAVGFWDLQSRAPSASRSSISRDMDLVSELTCSSLGAVALVNDGGSVFLLAPDKKQFKRLKTAKSIIHYETAIPVFSADGKVLAACSDRAILLWDIASGKLLRTIDTRLALVHRLAFHPAGKLLASAGNTKRIQLWDTTNGQEVDRYDWGIGPEIRCLAFSPDGMTAAAGGSSGKFVVWDVAGYVETTAEAVSASSASGKALENAILANPDDLGARAAYADWLIEQGDPRGEFMQIQLALEDESLSAPKRKDLKKREKALLKKHQEEWLGRLGPILAANQTGRHPEHRHSREVPSSTGVSLRRR